VNDRFDGRTVIVTGAGSGIGWATALRLASEGARVVATDLIPARVDAILKEIEALGRHPGVGVVADVADQDGVDQIVAAAGDTIHALANVAGILDGFLPVGDIDDRTWARVLDVNLTAPMRLTRAVVPLMQAVGVGSIVNVASEASWKGGISGVAYTATKHAVIGLTRSTAIFYGPSGIRCNAVCPGAVITNLEAVPGPDAAMEIVTTHLSAMPPPGSPEQLAAAICWLASDDSMNVNGAVLASDGGWSAS
jgi:NAD(P)-dependent dehydrogenase (short-subunit alcohol dehydrogenase family)